jgi:hypothetical protein
MEPAEYSHDSWNRICGQGDSIIRLDSLPWGQSPLVSPGGPWHSPEEQRIVTEARPTTAGVDRYEAVGERFYRETVPSFQIALELDYSLFDFGARRGRINAESN